MGRRCLLLADFSDLIFGGRTPLEIPSDLLTGFGLTGSIGCPVHDLVAGIFREPDFFKEKGR